MSGSEKTIPERGVPHDELLARMQQMREGDANWQDAKLWSLVFHQSDEHTELLKRAHNLFFDENALNPMAFKSLKQFESDVVRMAINLLNGDESCVGTMSSGGTESIMLAVRTYRDRARALRPEITAPEIVLPESAHVAFLKAGKYFDVKMVRAPLDDDFRVRVDEVETLINENTIALVGSAPQYPQGSLDPIEELAALAASRDLGMHVDSCIGGFFLPFIERLGFDVPPFDFRVPGVTSISADVHKYGYASKGASTVSYRSMDYLKYQFFVEVDWPGGVFASPSMPGTRPGGTIAAAWAALNAMGMNGYVDNAKKVMDVTRKLQDGVNAIDGLRVLGKPVMSVFAYGATDPKVNLYAVADRMAEKGWYIDRQQKPVSLHVMVNPGHAASADEYLADLREAVEYIREHPEAAQSGSAPTYGLIAQMPMREMVAEKVLENMMNTYGASGKGVEL